MVPKHISAVAILALLFISSSFAAISTLQGNPVTAPTVLANTSGASSYGDLLQYEWPQFQGDASFTRSSAGPAPNAPDIMWKTNRHTKLHHSIQWQGFRDKQHHNFRSRRENWKHRLEHHSTRNKPVANSIQNR